MTDSRATKQLMDVLERDGLLLVHDAVLPSATSIVAGEPVSGSWWSHPVANEIYDALQPLESVATQVKLLVQKVTFVHERLWPELVAIGSSTAHWQTDGLSDGSRAAVADLARRRSAVTTAQLLPDADKKDRLRLVRELEVRVLVHTEEVHTETGAHAKYVQTWRAFQRANGLGTGDLPDASAAQAVFDRIVADWPQRTKGPPLLPWAKKPRARNAG